ncbi:MAG: anaerobic sulfatase maturase [Oscillospiraceae bacterium]|nr:anaerobic sulfatase maturase [Oscillospiraceae bacterium]
MAVMAKPVGSRCNMRCAYCYYLDKGKYSESRKQTRMSFGLLEKLIRQTIDASPGPVVSFTWHGGEPTLAGMDFYKKALELERKYLPRGWEAWNNLQTNGLLLNEGWCRFLKENRFDVGLSIDGPAPVHDKNRRFLNGAGTFERVRASIRRLRDAGLEPDLLCTVNDVSQEAPLEVYRALRETGCGWVQFIPVVLRDGSEGILPGSVTPEGYGSFLTAVFDEWVTHDLGVLDVQLFAEMARVLAGGEASLCWMSPVCGHVLIAEEDGAVYSCDHFVDPEHRLGSLREGSLARMAGSAFQRAFGLAKRDTLTGECRACPWLRFCNGGCPKDRFGLSAEGQPGQYWLCPGLKTFFAHAQPILEKVMAMSAQGKKPPETMAVLNRLASAGSGSRSGVLTQQR